MATEIFAGLITVGPVLLWYDKDFLGLDTTGLEAINQCLVLFLQHDRITMAGTCLAIRFNDIGLAIGMRRGWVWAKRSFVVAGIVGLPTFLLALGYGFFDPLHFGSAAILLALFLAAAFRPGGPRNWKVSPNAVPFVRNRALLGQLVMLTCCVGIFVGGSPSCWLV